MILRLVMHLYIVLYISFRTVYAVVYVLLAYCDFAMYTPTESSIASFSPALLIELASTCNRMADLSGGPSDQTQVWFSVEIEVKAIPSLGSKKKKK